MYSLCFDDSVLKLDKKYDPANQGPAKEIYYINHMKKVVKNI